MSKEDIVIIGAGPYGLSVAARLMSRGLKPLVFGIPLKTWKDMPEGLLLRSKITPAFNPFGDGSFGFFLKEKGVVVEVDPPPISRRLFLEYGEWFLSRHSIVPREEVITALDGDAHDFLITTANGSRYQARQVIVASGINDYVHVPEEFLKELPLHAWVHTAACADLAHYKGKRVLIVGGRQAGLEWSALLAESSALVDTVYRHETPIFKTPDWDILKKIVAGTLADPAWFAHLPDNERDYIVENVRPAAKRQVEPWLEQRVVRTEVTLRPETTIERLYMEQGHVYAEVTSRNTKEGAVLGPYDGVIFATGYQPSIGRIPFLSPALRARITTAEAHPALNDRFESTVPGLYFTGLIAEKTFGPLLGFMAMCDASATILTRALTGND